MSDNWLTDSIALEAKYDEGYEAGKQAAVEQFAELIKTEISALNIAGIIHYVIAEHQLEELKKMVLEGK